MVNLPGYEIKKEIYSGEKSLVYRAVKGDKPVIIKVLQNEYPSQFELNSFRQEYEILEKIQSPRIVKVLGLEKHKNSLAIILEDIGGDAVSLIHSEIRNLLEKEIIKILVECAKALEEVHKQGLVHKDIKSHNIILNLKTRELQIIDFGNASLLTKQNSYTSLNSSLEGTLAYISPEQTGRMNRTVDYRTDYYSLGVTFYQVLTGELPFVSSDPMELVHSHIAKMPLPPFEKNKTNKVLSGIVMKLLQKNPEDRYQSIAGLLYDLEWCLTNSAKTMHEISLHDHNFQIGIHDFSGKFQIPEKLYGRTKEIQEIVHTFKETVERDATSLRGVSLHLISGRSGIGKSALINEVNKPITEYKGYFASGKYDLFKRAIPYYAITLAFQNLIQQILTSDQKEIVFLKESLLKALGVNGQVIIDVIPELENLIGKQPPIVELGASESQNRFNLVFQNFIQAFCMKEHPIAIFLDDMQWADNPSISLIQNILSNPEMKYLYLMLSFRDNEVLPMDSFALMLENLKKSGFIYKEILLEPISVSDISQLVSDTLKCKESKANELSEILFEKTKGNPFFVNELFTSFYKDGLVYYESDDDILRRGTMHNVSTERWNWDISKIRETKISENVIDLMVEKVKELSPNQMELLKLAACVGDLFSLETFFQLVSQEIEEVNRELTAISNEGFLLLTANQVRFVHDKVREATYSLLTEEERAKKHYAIGSTFLRITKEEEVEENVFTIVNQLNQGIQFISEDEKAKLLDLNVLAGDRAFKSSAYETALSHFKVSASLLPSKAWEDKYDSALYIYTKLGRMEYLIGEYSEANKYFNLVLSNAKAILEKISVYETQIELYTSKNQLREALEIGMKALSILGVSFPEIHDPTVEFGKFFQLIEKKNVSELLNVPLNFEAEKFAILRLLASCITPAYITLPSQLPLIVIKIVNISIESGNFVVSAMGYSMIGNILCSGMGNYNLGNAFGKLGMDVVDKYDLGFLKTTVYFIYATMINHWKNHASTDLNYLLEAYKYGILNGNIQFASYSVNHYNFKLLLMRKNLGEVVLGFDKYSHVFHKMKDFDAFLMFKLYHQLTLNLSGLGNSELTNLNSSIFEEEQTVLHWLEFKNTTTLYSYYIAKMILHYFFGSTLESYRLSREGEQYEGGCFGMMFVAEHNFWDSLICIELSNTDERKYLEQIHKNQERMKVWAENCPANYGHKYYIIEAELARIEGNTDNALELYDKAISLAKEHEYILEEAIANELLAKFWLGKRKQVYANTHLREAHYAYKRWGCEPKLKQLEEKYSELKRYATSKGTYHPTISSGNSSFGTSTTGGSFLDLNTVVKASQTLAGEIYLGKLLEKMMKILFENAGAEKGFFILKKKEKLIIEAEGNANTGNISVLEEKPLENNENISANIVNYVVRTNSIVLLSDAVKKGMFVNDVYVKNKQPKSILCYPVINQGNLVGVVYLENNLTTDAFTPDRVEILKILSSQIAVSVENSLLYANLEEKVEERTKDLNEALVEVRGLKEQQDGDYFLNTLLLEPLGQNNAFSNLVDVEFFVKQKKSFEFRNYEYELGGDINISENIELQGKKYIVFLNGDAMGKSIQGAGGVIVLGTVFKSIIQRTLSTEAGKNVNPERWVKNAFVEMHKAFESFDGSMLMSTVFGLIEEQTGIMYFVNVEHPEIVLYRDGVASFIECKNPYRKLGTQGQSGSITVEVFSLRTDDVVILGSDGRDDIILGKESDSANDIINQDEKLFLYHVKNADGDLEKIFTEITKTGILMDDLSLLKIHYKGLTQNKEKLEEDLKIVEDKNQKELERSKSILDASLKLEPENLEIQIRLC